MCLLLKIEHKINVCVKLDAFKVCEAGCDGLANIVHPWIRLFDLIFVINQNELAVNLAFV